jgi:hypothetical protein
VAHGMALATGNRGEFRRVRALRLIAVDVT